MKQVWRKVKSFLLGLVYSVPFGMRAGDDEIFRSKASSESEENGIHQRIVSTSLCDDLLNARVTQEVRNLRYRTYYVAEEARHYKYLGGERATKLGRITPKNPNIIKFKMDNRMIVDSVMGELARVGTYSSDSFTLKIKTKEFPLFKMERYIKSFNVNINKETGENLISFTYPNYANEGDVKYKVFLRMLHEPNGKDVSFLRNIDEISFVARGVEGINDFTGYRLHDATLLRIYGDENKIITEYSFATYDSTNLLEKYYEENLDKKYKNKERKEHNTISINFNESDRLVKKCSLCGKPISEFDADMSMEAVGKELCVDCLSTQVVE